jgi:hypothetical protein
VILRIILLLVAIGVVLGGFILIRDTLEERKKEEYVKFASIISETSVAAGLYHNAPDSFVVARDSIFQKYGVTDSDLSDFREKLKKDERQWLQVWEYVRTITDSLVGEQMARLSAPKADSLDSLNNPHEKGLAK